MPSSRRQRSLSKSTQIVSIPRHRRCTDPAIITTHPANAMSLAEDTTAADTGTYDPKQVPAVHTHPHSGIHKNISGSSTRNIHLYQHRVGNTPSSSSISSSSQKSSRQNIHLVHASHQSPSPRYPTYHPRSSSDHISTNAAVEHLPRSSAHPYHSNRGTYYICQYGQSAQSNSPLTAPATLYYHTEPASALLTLPEHRHTMKYSHSHRSQSHRFAGYDYINGPNPDMLSYSAQQNHTAASATASSSSPSSAVPGSATAGASYLLEGRPLTAEEKELKRKVSHSAIEKRRRERTNTVLRELQGIIPSLSKSGKIQKLEILEAAAEYIRDLTTAPKPANEAETSSLHSETLGSTKSRGNRLGCSQEYGSNFGNFQLPRTCAETTSLETVLEQQQHPAVATPMSVSSNASNDDSSDDALANKLPKAASSSPDPCSMKVDFLLCQE